MEIDNPRMKDASKKIQFFKSIDCNIFNNVPEDLENKLKEILN